MKQMASETILTKRFIPKDSFVSRQIMNEIIIVPIAKKVQDVDSMYSINSTGARIWELMDGTNSLEQIIRKITEEYNIDESTASHDVVEFATKLLSIEALDEASDVG
jgi:hypothetical protein